MNIFFIASIIFSPSVYAFATPSFTSSGSSASTSIGMSSSSSSSLSASSGDIAVVGCGVLGTSLCRQLLSSPDFKGRSVTGITKTTNNHESIKEQVLNEKDANNNFHLSTFDTIPKEKQFTDVVFCAPPSGFDDYPSAIQSVIDTLWAGGSDSDSDSSSGSKKGVFVFTSSGGIYGPGDGETVSETTPIPVATSPRTLRLLKAELNVIAAGGCVLRLAGLYTLERGAHNYWLDVNKSKGQVKGSKGGIINLLHYDDAAGSCVAALKKGDGGVDNENHTDINGKVFLISDGHPTTRIGICESALKSKTYSGLDMPSFGEDDSGGKGKIYDGHWSNDVLSWDPVYSSFDEFMKNS